MFERLTDRARKVMALANQEAQRFNHEYIGTEHILLGLVKEGSGVGANVLKNAGHRSSQGATRGRETRQEWSRDGDDGQVAPDATGQEGPRVRHRRSTQSSTTTTSAPSTSCLGLLREHGRRGCAGAHEPRRQTRRGARGGLNLLGAGVEPEEVGGIEPQSEAEGDAPQSGRRGKSKTPALDSFGRDLTELAASGELDPVIGRAKRKSNDSCRSSAAAQRTTLCC